MKTIALMIAFIAILIIPRVDHAAPKDPLKALDFLLGDWRGEPPSIGSDVFRRDLDGKVIVRAAESDSVLGTKVVAMKMAMTIYNEPGRGLMAIYFDNNGHIIHYKVGALVAGSSVRWDSDATDPGPRFRLTYSIHGKDQLAVRFEMAPPDAPSEYQVIAEGIDTRVTG